MKVFSGNCCLCDVGMPVGAQDESGNELHTGDIVIINHGDYIGTELERWSRIGGLTVVVSDQYKSFSDGTVEEIAEPKPFVMGIKDCGFNHPEWRIELVKKFSDVIDGEHWPAYRFSYKIAA